MKFIDFLMVVFFLVTMITTIAVSDTFQDSYILIYFYFQLLATYLTFRVKYIPILTPNNPNSQASYSLLFRLHAFNFLFSIFTLV